MGPQHSAQTPTPSQAAALPSESTPTIDSKLTPMAELTSICASLGPEPNAVSNCETAQMRDVRIPLTDGEIREILRPARPGDRVHCEHRLAGETTTRCWSGVYIKGGRYAVVRYDREDGNPMVGDDGCEEIEEGTLPPEAGVEIVSLLI
jgi:hypothetical protein